MDITAYYILGLFCVPHSDDYDRLICDGRATNVGESRLHWAWLPHGCMIAKVMLRPHQGLGGSGTDLEVWFFQLKGHADNLCRRALHDPLSAAEVSAYGLDPDLTWYTALAVRGMGGRNSADIAREVHERLARRRLVCRELGPPLRAGLALRSYPAGHLLGRLRLRCHH